VQKQVPDMPPAACSTQVSDQFVEASLFRLAMRQMASAVTIVTSGSGPCRRGLTATAVCSLSADPPSLLVCINKQTECHETIRRNGHFCVNALGADDQGLAGRFAGRDGSHGLARFAAGSWAELVTGAPVLQEAIAVFDCKLLNACDGGTHSIFVGGILAARVNTSQPILIYHSGSFVSLPQ
jgi:flavin reductase (DIM6/NTAB) family NADH-FMN oxidoreductase RutF